MSEPASLPEDWDYVDTHSFIGMSVVAETTAGKTIDGEIAAIWIYAGEPRRLDIDHGGDTLLNIDRNRVEVFG